MNWKFNTLIVLLLNLSFVFTGCNQVEDPQAYGPVPSENQINWQKMEYYAFIHFSINTYTNQEWGDGGNDPRLFNPTALDCRQWARVCKEAGMKGIILTAKHHDGFCLWPSEYTDYSVKNSPWRDGKGDLVRELADACKEYGLKLGIYLSPWDRNYADYGKPEYITYFRNQLKELLTNYGDIFEVWFDGANGGSGYYGGAWENRKIDAKTYYDWENTFRLIRELQPKAVIWNDGGNRGDLRWCGNESGSIGETNWSLLDAKGDVKNEWLRYGKEDGDSWVPGEVNVSIRPGWFYHEYEDGRVKTLPELLTIYYNSFGRNAPLLLNFPIDCRGLIHENDEKAVLELAAAVKEIFAENLARKTQAEASNVRGNSKRFGADKMTDDDEDTYWATDDGVTNATVTVDFGKPTVFNRFLIREYIRLGQRVKAFTVEAFVNNEWRELAKETTIGYKRILCFPTTEATKIRFHITDSKACPLISDIGVYNAPQVLTPPEIFRNQSGDIRIVAADNESEIYYTLDGSVPGPDSEKYAQPVKTDGRKVNIKAIAYDPSTKKSSPVAGEQFDISRKNWKVLNIADEKVNDIMDGNIHTAWFNEKDVKMPIDLIIDLGNEEELSGFRYLPGQGWKKDGMITNYEFYTSMDNQQWTLADKGEFSNIRNNPLWQIKSFKPVKARYIKLKALKNTHNNDAAGYAEFDLITE